MTENTFNQEQATAAPVPGSRLQAIDDGFTPEAVSGSGSAIFADRLSQQVVGCQVLPADKEALTLRVMAAVTALKELGPQNVGEGMLAAQMVAAHNIGLEFLARAVQLPAGDKGAEANTRQGARLLALYMKQLEQLGRQRGRRRQSVSIEHEHEGGDGRVRLRAEEERVR